MFKLNLRKFFVFLPPMHLQADEHHEPLLHGGHHRREQVVSKQTFIFYAGEMKKLNGSKINPHRVRDNIRICSCVQLGVHSTFVQLFVPLRLQLDLEGTYYSRSS